jgi:hypothetical protein
MVYNKTMSINDFIKLAKKAQARLKEMGYPAQHIYLIGYSTPSKIPSFAFISDSYNSLDLYDRIRLSSTVRTGPLKYDFHVLGPKHIANNFSSINKEDIYKATKIYGKNPLVFNEVEFATKQDFIFNNFNFEKQKTIEK